MIMIMMLISCHRDCRCSSEMKFITNRAGMLWRHEQCEKEQNIKRQTDPYGKAMKK